MFERRDTPATVKRAEYHHAAGLYYTDGPAAPAWTKLQAQVQQDLIVNYGLSLSQTSGGHFAEPPMTDAGVWFALRHKGEKLSFFVFFVD